jgi:hypothetical protein
MCTPHSDTSRQAGTYQSTSRIAPNASASPQNDGDGSQRERSPKLRAKLKCTMRLKMAQMAARKRIRNRSVVQRALELRVTGATYVEIGCSLRLSTTRAYQLVRAGLGEINAELTETASQLRQMELERLDAIHAAHWPKRENPRNAEIILRVMERRARLLGLDAPAKIEQTSQTSEELLPTFDPSRLTDNELLQLEALYEKAAIAH